MRKMKRNGRKGVILMSLPKISKAFLSVTDACNLACKYCFVNQKPVYMSYDTAKDAADWLYQNWIANDKKWIPGITFFGGEPTLLWDSVVRPLCEYVRSTYEPLFGLSMTTNGVLLDEEKLAFLRDNNVTILLSMDGDAETQDAQRVDHNGNGVFHILEPKLKLILDYLPSTGFRSTITAQSADKIMHNVMFAADHGFSSWFGMPNDFEKWDDKHIEMLRTEVQKFGDYFISTCRDGKRPIVFSSFERMFHAIMYINNAITNNVCRNSPGCSACYRCGTGGTHYAAIDACGRVFACQDLCSRDGEDSPFYLGNIYDGVDDSRREALIALYDGTRCYGKDCSACRLNRICDGGCVANNYMLNGDIRHVPEIHCEWYQMLLEEAMAQKRMSPPQSRAVLFRRIASSSQRRTTMAVPS